MQQGSDPWPLTEGPADKTKEDACENVVVLGKALGEECRQSGKDLFQTLEMVVAGMNLVIGHGGKLKAGDFALGLRIMALHPEWGRWALQTLQTDVGKPAELDGFHAWTDHIPDMIPVEVVQTPEGEA